MKREKAHRGNKMAARSTSFLCGGLFLLVFFFSCVQGEQLIAPHTPGRKEYFFKEGGKGARWEIGEVFVWSVDCFIIAE